MTQAETSKQAVELYHRIDHTGGPHAYRVVLIHGVGDNLDTWDRVLGHLPPGFDVLRYELRGHGRSERPSGPYLLADFVADHLSILSLTEFAPCALVGFSLGGLIAQAVAIEAPAASSPLVILSAVAGRTADDWAKVRERLNTLRREGPVGMARASAARWYTDEFTRREPETVAARLERLARNDYAAYLASYEVLASNDLLEDLPRISQPTLIMTGELDVGSPPRMAQLMHESIRASDVVIVPRIKHELLVEVPEIVAMRVSDFVKSKWPFDESRRPAAKDG